MLTAFGAGLDKENILPEYPRPQLRRGSFLCLNGRWEFGISDGPDMPERLSGSILVPFSPESELSGAESVPEPGQFLWYRRRVTLPEGFFFPGGRLLLNFGAADQVCCVYVNGRLVCTHTGGFTPFSADITDAVSGAESFELIVRVQDFTDGYPCARGKQSLRSGGVWHRAQSGIWQTVWLESVPERYIRGLRIIPHFDGQSVELWVAGEGECRAVIDGEETVFPAGSPVVIPLREMHAWSPEEPYLYPLELTLGEDRVESYFAMRKFSAEPGEDGQLRLCLNGRPYFHNGVIDQGLWPDGLMTPPSDEAMIFDIRTAKDMGFGAIRKLAKVEPLRWYYHCDRLGMIVWQDMPCGGGKYGRGAKPPSAGLHLSDSRYAAFGRKDEMGRELYYTELREMINALYNCPCIAVWTAFNEGWGQFDSKKAASFIRRMDRSRTIDPASGWHDQRFGELRSYHVSGRSFVFTPDTLGRAVALTHFGGLIHRIEGHCESEKCIPGRRFDSANSLAFALRGLYGGDIFPAVKDGLSAAFYSQLTDAGEELDGLMTADRRVLKLPAKIMRGIAAPGKNRAK